MDVAIAGCGAVAREYTNGLSSHDELHLVAVADIEQTRADSLATDTGCTAYSDVATMLQSARPALVINLTSHAEHASVTRQCLEAGAHVYSEKPLALDSQTAIDLVELAVADGLGLGCAPVTHRFEQQRLAAERLDDGTLGAVRVVSATAHVGRVTEWHDRPASFLEVGPLFDGAVYPLTLLVEWFGPVKRIRTADAARPYPPREDVTPTAPTHVEATFEFHDGPLCRLTASYYVPHRARDFYGVEIHGDDASLFLADTGDLGGDREPLVAVGRAGREYTPVPLQRPPNEANPIRGVAALVDDIQRGSPPVAGGRRAAHVVAICNAIERATESVESIPVDRAGFEPEPRPDVRVRPAPRSTPGSSMYGDGAAIRLPPIGFGCSRYRDGEYVDRMDSIATALDAGYRMIDSAELYGNEARIGELLSAPGSPDREVLFLTSKVWNTNHGHVREACESTIDALGVDALDGYLLHWPESWRYTGPLRDLASLPVEEREARTFPTDEDGEPMAGETSLKAAWRGLEEVLRTGLTRTIGICNVDVETLEEVLGFAEIPPAIVQVERHPYLPRDDLLERCHARGIRVIAHSPLSAPGLLAEPVLRSVAEVYDATPAQVVIAWNVAHGVVPIPSSVDSGHVVENAVAAGLRLDRGDLRRIDGLADPSFER